MSLGARIRQYRTARGYALDDLVDRMGSVVSKQALSKYEHDKATPRPTVLVAIAKALDVKSAQLLAEPVYTFEMVAYRAMATLGVSERTRIESEVALQLENRLALMDRLGIDLVFPFAESRVPVSDVRDAEHAAEDLRRSWDLGGGPIASLADTLESKGVHVLDVSTQKRFDGLAVYAVDSSGHRVACGMAARVETSRARQRMNYAHETGHLAMEPADCVDAERAAARFGGALLFPAEAVFATFGRHRGRITTEELLLAKERWGLSIQAVLYRLRDLDIIDEASYRWWCMRINKSGWRVEEPGDEPREVPTWTESMALRAAAEGLIAAESAAVYAPHARTGRIPGDIDRRALMKLPLEDRRALIRMQAESIAAEYNRGIDHAWLAGDFDDD